MVNLRKVLIYLYVIEVYGRVWIRDGYIFNMAYMYLLM